MLSTRNVVEKTLDAIELFVNWAVAWAVALIILGSPLLILGLQSDAVGAQTVSRFFLASMLVVYGVGALLALADLALRARSKGNIFVVMRTAWRHASTSRAANAMSPLATAGRQLAATLRALMSTLLSLGLRLLGGLLLAVIGGFVIYLVFGLLGTAPWWAVVIIVLLLIK